MLSQQVAIWKASQSGHDPEAVDQQLVALQNQLASLRARYTDDYPDVLKAKKDLDNFEKKKSRRTADQKPPVETDKTTKPLIIEPDQVAQLRGQIHSYDQIIAEKTKNKSKSKSRSSSIKAASNRVPKLSNSIRRLTRGYQAALESYNELQKKRRFDSAMSAELERKNEEHRFRVLDPRIYLTSPPIQIGRSSP